MDTLIDDDGTIEGRLIQSRESSVSSPQGVSLLVFSDDWGRHPSSCQHLIRHLLPRIPTAWVNTIGMRTPTFDLATIRRAAEKLRHWSGAGSGTLASLPENLSVWNPRMWPAFSGPASRRLNRYLLNSQLQRRLGSHEGRRVAVTTIPIVADLMGRLPVDRWVYYCVDDFSQWPGLDHDTLRRMDCEMIQQADSLVAVSETLQTMIADEGRSASLLTHGVDLNFWNSTSAPSCESPKSQRPSVVFWGVIDRRMDSASLRKLSQDMLHGTIVLIGPQQNPDPVILSLPNVRTLPAQPLAALPAIAGQADVLIMPYADLPVTRAMQPLKLKEYLATGKPVVVSRLPSTDSWSDCLDVAESPEQFSQLVRDRIATGIPATQATARNRLQQESWRSKAAVLEKVLKENK